MDIQSNISLAAYSTMRLGGPTKFLATAANPGELVELINQARSQNLPFFVLGGGSNVIIRDEGFAGLTILNRIAGFDVLSQDNGDTVIKIGAGENWDSVVKRTVEMNLTGIEALSAIPGTAGATPVQNVGAYGQEISDTLVELEAYNTETNQFVVLKNEDCAFSYRSSIFKDPTKRHHVIINITLRLSQGNPTPPFYQSLQTYLDTHQITYFTPQVIRDAVIAIRADKLPDPSIYPNTGSFFKNPIIEKWQYEELRKEYDDMPGYAMDNDHIKVPASWLIERAGMKGHEGHGMRTFDKNALVLVNVSAKSYTDLEAFKEEIRGAVRDQFRINLEQEPETL